VDLGLIFFTTWSLLSLLRWRGNGFQARDLIFAGVACGLALGTKYNALPAFLLLSFLVPVLYVRNQPKNPAASGKVLLWGACFASIALAVFSPWMIRNLIWTGNPLYPLYDGLFNPGGSGHGSSLGPWAIRKLVYGESWWETLLIPLRVFFQGQDDLPQLFDGRLNPLLLILPIFAFLSRPNRAKRVNRFEGPAEEEESDVLSERLRRTLQTEKLALLGFSAGYLLIAFFTTDMRVRYISPIIPPLVILAVLGFQNLCEMTSGGDRQAQNRTPWRTLVIFGVLVLFSLNGSYIFQLFGKVDPVPYISGQVTRDAYITRHRPEYPAIAFVNRSLPQDARILSIFLGNRRYYFEREVLFDLALVQSALTAAASPEDLRRSLKSHGVSHFVVGTALFNNWVTENLSPSQRSLLQGFFNEKTRVLFIENGHAVLDLS
jgi:4-amino-4-deoxy-L-arabinose transferase-like glycosyltransferase